MSYSPRVSIVMPTYEAADYLQQCLQSIVSQSYEDFKLIIVDDGSTDETIPIIESFDDERIRLIQRDEESGIPSARNRGIEAASGEYIACHDADDRSHPERLTKQVAYLDTHTDVAAVGSGARLVNEDGAVFARRRVLELPTFETLLQQNHFVHGSALFRRSTLNELGCYDEWFQLAEDYELFLRLAKKYPVRNIDEPLYDLRIRTDSVYASELEEISLYGYAAKKKVSDGPDWKSLQRRIETDGLGTLYDQFSPGEKAVYHQNVSRELLRYGELTDARSHARDAIECNRRRVMPYLLFLLSMTSPIVSKTVARAYRKLLVNPRIILANNH